LADAVNGEREPPTKENQMDALDELEQMHQSARKAFGQIQSASSADRAGLWAKLHADLLLHEKIEEQFVYDPVVEQLGSQHPKIAQFHDLHETEAKQASEIMSRIGGLDATSDRWLSEVNRLSSLMDGHMRMEETEFWPLIREEWGEQNLQDAAGKVSAAKSSGSVGASTAGA
jgi:iron-sulfur cluster repair protein YtfE (RIC family)